MKITIVRILSITLLILISINTTAFSQVKILFDATKAESAGNADWVIDADTHNLSWSNGPAVVGAGDESNPQRIPTPAQSVITSTTAETYWEGGISAWGVDMVKKGYTVETLPVGTAITYNNSSNAQDLKNYKVFVVCEPNILFTSAEKTAILAFVQNGGGLFMVADHAGSDRNNDGNDPPVVWNDLMDTTGVHPFGIHFDHVSISGVSTNIASLSSDTLLHGPMGNVAEVQWSAGTTMTLSTTNNSTVKGIVYKSGVSNTGLTNVLVARAKYGAGRVVGFGDSSPCDDGTGDPNDVLYTGWTGDAAGNHEKLIVNATIWLASGGVTTIDESIEIKTNTQIVPNPFSTSANLIIDPFVELSKGELAIYDMNGRRVRVIPTDNMHSIKIEKENLRNGMYFYTLTSDDKLIGNGKFIITE